MGSVVDRYTNDGSERGADVSKREAQREMDRVDSELNELYRQVREKEAERDGYDRVAHPEDY